MSNAKPILPESIPGLAEVIGRTGNYTDFMKKELVLRCHDCNQVLQVGADQMQAFVVIPDGVLCKACELLNRNNPKP